jgi:hypothetical protein
MANKAVLSANDMAPIVTDMGGAKESSTPRAEVRATSPPREGETYMAAMLRRIREEKEAKAAGRA